MFRALRLVALVSCLQASVLYCQEFRATVTGHVLDASAAAMPKVTVQVVNLATNETAVAV